MARKRMISPEIWESQSFGELSLLAKILFIGMISQADDDGKGILSPQLLKSKILPYDELRVADVDKALKEIGHNASVAECADADKAREERGHKLSVTYYEVDGKKYYIFDNWKKWQTICRPIPSKLPNPPVRGVGEDIHSHEAVNEYSMSNHGVVNECSDRKEEIKEKRNEEYGARVREDTHPKFIPPTLAEVKAYCSERKNTVNAEKFFDFYTAKGWYVGKNKMRDWQAAVRTWEQDEAARNATGGQESSDGYMKHEYTDEQLKAVCVNFDDWEE